MEARISARLDLIEEKLNLKKLDSIRYQDPNLASTRNLFDSELSEITEKYLNESIRESQFIDPKILPKVPRVRSEDIRVDDEVSESTLFSRSPGVFRTSDRESVQPCEETGMHQPIEVDEITRLHIEFDNPVPGSIGSFLNAAYEDED